MTSVVYAALFYVATMTLAGGLLLRVWQYATTPAPATRSGVVLRMAREVALFESLFKANLWIWLFGWVFHASPPTSTAEAA